MCLDETISGKTPKETDPRQLRARYHCEVREELIWLADNNGTKEYSKQRCFKKSAMLTEIEYKPKVGFKGGDDINAFHEWYKDISPNHLELARIL